VSSQDQQQQQQHMGQQETPAPAPSAAAAAAGNGQVAAGAAAPGAAAAGNGTAAGAHVASQQQQQQTQATQQQQREQQHLKDIKERIEALRGNGLSEVDIRSLISVSASEGLLGMYIVQDSVLGQHYLPCHVLWIVSTRKCPPCNISTGSSHDNDS
jgi:hypothetical protein